MNLDDYPLIADWVTSQGDRLVVHSGKVDIGQRISTALAQIAHEELGIPLDQIDVAPVRTDHAPDEGMTSGSNSIEQSGHAVRCATASLRDMVRSILAERFGGVAEDWVLEDGDASLPGTNHRVSVLDVLEDISEDERVDVSVKPAERAKVPRVQMRGICDMVRGTFAYVHDMDVPGMLHARVVRPPHVQARLKSISTAAREKLASQSVTLVEDGSFVAVAATGEWAVVRAAQSLALACDWDMGEGLPETDVFTLLNASKATRLAAPDALPTEGDIPGPIASDHTARYERPYQMHGALAPSAAMAEWRDDRLTLHCHSQGIYPLRASIADTLGLREAQVDITHVPGSGCYGHNGADDAAFEAALVAMAIPGRPILLKWSREDEHMWEPFASAMAVEVAAKVSDGRIEAFSAEAFSDTHRGRPRAGPNRAGPRKLLANRFRADAMEPPRATPNMGQHAGMHRNLDPIYAIPVKRLVKNLVPDLPHRTSAMRCLGAAANVFAIESFMSDLADREGIDSIEFRLSQLEDPRAKAVLNELDRQVKNWPAMPEGSGRGVGYAQYKNEMTRVGVCVELAVSEQAEVHLRRAAIVGDAGRVIDADGLTAQLEGGFVQAASWALYEEVTWDRDGIQSRDWDSYPVIRFGNIPEIDVTLLDMPGDKSVGAGEASPGPTIAAIRNAIRDATGIPMYRMPFTPTAIKDRAMQSADV